MQSFVLKEVGNNAGLVAEFLQLPVTLYKAKPLWVRPLDTDIEEVFDPKKNKMFRSGNCIRWVLADAKGKVVGRVAAFYDKRLWKGNQPKVGGMGFFECIDSQEAANVLFDACEKWLTAEGAEGMDGSINFGDRDKHWGILVEGFDKSPNYGMPYTHEYYPQLFENYSFKLYFYQLTYHRFVETPLSEKMQEKYLRVMRDPSIRFCYYEPGEMTKYVKAFHQIYNEAWGKHTGVPQMSEAHVQALFTKLKPVMDKRLLWFGFQGERPIAFYLMLPELNQYFKHVNGKLDLLGKIKFAWYKYFVGVKKAFGVAFGVVPDFQGKGIEGAIVVECSKVVQKKKLYEEIEMNWIGDFNPKMLHLLESLNTTVVKRHATYRLYFDRSYPFERMKDI